MAHTQGPWTVGPDEQGRCITHEEKSPRDGKLIKFYVATVYRFAGLDCNLDDNAHLIAAAPDLLRALVGDHGDRMTFIKNVLAEAHNLPLPNGMDWDTWTVTMDEVNLFIKESEAAIAKAKGTA